MTEDTIDCEFCGREAELRVRHEVLDDRAEWRPVYVTPLCSEHSDKAMVMVRCLSGGRLVVAHVR